jgi:hypothetical protein
MDKRVNALIPEGLYRARIAEYVEAKRRGAKR